MVCSSVVVASVTPNSRPKACSADQASDLDQTSDRARHAPAVLASQREVPGCHRSEHRPSGHWRSPGGARAHGLGTLAQKGPNWFSSRWPRVNGTSIVLGITTTHSSRHERTPSQPSVRQPLDQVVDRHHASRRVQEVRASRIRSEGSRSQKRFWSAWTGICRARIVAT